MVLMWGFVLVILLYLMAIMPRMMRRPDYTDLFGRYYTHRGLYDNTSDAPENSMSAFKKSVNADYGIEFDVQLTKDRIPVIVHDETLKRVCGVKGNVRDYTYEELHKFTLFQSKERIPLLADFLKMVDGKVPLIVEIKIHENVHAVCSAVDELLKEYHGSYCVESFHPMAVKWYKEHHPQVIRGQLSTNFNTDGKKESLKSFIVHYLVTNFITKPDFIAYDHRHKKNVSRILCRYLYRALSVTWTVKSQKELDACREAFDLFIFEGFIPREKE